MDKVLVLIVLYLTVLLAFTFYTSFSYQHKAIISRSRRFSSLIQRKQITPRSRSLSSFAMEEGHMNEKIGIIIVDHGSKRKEANDMLLQLVERFKSKSQYEIVEAAHMELAEPSIQAAYTRCIQQGARRIICHPYFLSFGKHVRDDIPHLLAEAAKEHPESRYEITDPLGVQESIPDLIWQTVQKAI